MGLVGQKYYHFHVCKVIFLCRDVLLFHFWPEMPTCRLRFC